MPVQDRGKDCGCCNQGVTSHWCHQAAAGQWWLRPALHRGLGYGDGLSRIVLTGMHFVHRSSEMGQVREITILLCRKKHQLAPAVQIDREHYTFFFDSVRHFLWHSLKTAFRHFFDILSHLGKTLVTLARPVTALVVGFCMCRTPQLVN